MTVPASFRQSDVTRAVKGVLAAGREVYEASIQPNGTIRLVLAQDGKEAKGWEE